MFLFVLLVVAVAAESNHSSAPFDFESEMSTEMFTERSVGGSNSNSDDPSFNNSVVNGTEFVSAMTTGMPMEHKVKRSDNEWGEPYCDNSTERNVSVRLGHTANLCCRVPHIGIHPLVWLGPDNDTGYLHFLAVGEQVLRDDSRIMSSQLQNPDDWNLKIRSTTLKDAGLYMCQIKTIPYTSIRIVLNIVVPKATIQEGSNLYVQSGTDIDLTCVINWFSPPFTDFKWFKDDLNMDQHSSITLSYTHEKGYTFARHLWIFRAQSTNSGNYTCKPTNADQASISVHVFNGRIPETTTVEPVTTTVEPVTTTVEPVTTTVEPVTTTVEPVTTTVEPVTSTVEPVTTTVEPVTTIVEPVTTIVEPVTTTVEPVTTTVEPVTTTVEPVTTIVEPVTTTVEPVTTTVEPQTTTVKPVTTTVEPVTTPVTVHHGQQPSSAFRFMPFLLLLLLLYILWILKRRQMLSRKVNSPPYQDIRLT